MKRIILPGILFASLSVHAQLYIDNAQLFIDNGAIVTVQGDVSSNTNILVNGAAGTGKIRMAGTATQNLNMGGNTIPNLQIDNATGVVLTGAATVGTLLEFTTGKLQLGSNDLTLAAAATTTGAGTGKFAETNGTGTCKKIVTAASTQTLPVGNGTNYSPLTYTLTGGTYAASAWVGARSVTTTHPKMHPRSSEYLNSYWDLTNNGITGGTKTATGTYADVAGYTKNASGAETDIKSFVWNGTAWAVGSAQDATTNTISATISGATQQLYGMNKFILVAPKVFLEGAFDPATGMMKDVLRSNNLIQASDPYRAITGFTHVANAITETAAASVFTDQTSVAGSGAQKNIVDWVFLELRSNASPSVVQQTRSALIQRNGNIVDIDGSSSIYFKNLPDGSYNLYVKHRNHLGVRTKTAIALGINSSANNFTTAVSSAYSDAAITANAPMKELTVTSAPNAWVMFGSNANADAKTTKVGPAAINDYSILLTGVTSTLGYYKMDYNMDGKVSKTGPAALNDYSKLLGTLAGSSTINQHNN